MLLRINSPRPPPARNMTNQGRDFGSVSDSRREL